MGRHWFVVVAFCAALVGALSACAHLNASGSATASAQSDAPAACYRQSDLGDGWERLEHWTDNGCFASDSCFGGLGTYAPGCYKWATGPDAPPLQWPAETETAPARIVPPEDEIPLEHGLFVIRRACEEVTCGARWRADARVPIYAEPDQFSRRVGRLDVSEVVSAVETVQYVPARRAVMRYSVGEVAAGDVVYALWRHCKGYDAWRRGELFYIDGDEVDWDPSPRLYNSRAGDWVRFERANGERGWARSFVLGNHLTAMDPRPQPEPAAEGEDFDECE